MVSKYDLDTELYGPLINDKEAYALLGFKETELDSNADAFEQVDKLDDRNKKLLLRQLARELGYKLTDAENDHSNNNDSSDDVFNIEEYISYDFPVSRVRNMDSLIEHVRQQFFCADQVKYEKVLRQIRTSKPADAARAYVKGMYTNDSYMEICQMCKKPATQIFATEIANYGIELPQFHLCLCPTCSGVYTAIKESNKNTFSDKIKTKILEQEIDEDQGFCSIDLNGEVSLTFTETHLAELQTAYMLLAEFGVPDANRTEEIHVEKDNAVITENKESLPSNEPSAISDVPIEEKDDIPPDEPLNIDMLYGEDEIQDGNLVSYKKMQSLEIVDAVIDSEKYPLHKAFIGKKVGDLIVVNGRRYLIVSVL